ncbi:ATP-binding protein [Microbacterium sp. 179-I 3D3 NHS]|uniref:ATP-binding protein n=1 Tax=Microbacterium sp. 179-I 3D3 NHS TaxID=3142382 RepID=UPI0039A27EB0
MRRLVGPHTLVTFDGRSSAGGEISALVSIGLRAAVTDRQRLMTERVVHHGVPWLVIGTPVMVTTVDGSRSPSGVEVYTAVDLAGVDREVGASMRSAAVVSMISLPVAVVLALLTAGSVLRPLRRLGETTRRLAAGDLEARSQPTGDDEIGDLTTSVNEMADAVQRMQADARRFAADVSHELRTPLSTLTAVMEVLRDSAAQTDSEGRESAELAVAETSRLVRLVEDLMEVSRFDAGSAELRREDVDVVEAVRRTLDARGLLDAVRIVAPHRLRARIDRRRVDVIVANLVGNALRHGGTDVEVTLSHRDGVISLEVADRGPGLPADVLPHIFDRFFKADAARARSTGSGLGLALARENARLHGGDIAAGNRAGGGARFVLTLPQDPEDG